MKLGVDAIRVFGLLWVDVGEMVGNCICCSNDEEMTKVKQSVFVETVDSCTRHTATSLTTLFSVYLSLRSALDAPLVTAPSTVKISAPCYYAILLQIS